MRKILLIISLFFSVAAFAQDSYTIKGEVVDGVQSGDTLYLMSNLTAVPKVESMAVVKNGRFSFSGAVSEPLYSAIISFEKNTVNRRAELFIEKGIVNVKIGKQGYAVKGTFLNDRLQQYRDSIAPMKAIYDKYASKIAAGDITPAALAEAHKVMLVTSVARAEYAERYLRKNIDNAVALCVIRENYELFSPAKGLELLSMLPDNLADDTSLAAIKNYYKGSLRASEGSTFVNVELSDTQGCIRNLADFVGKGKIVILNFWSSSNAASVKEQQQLRLMQQNSRDRIVAVGISLDTNPVDWLKTIKEKNLPQIQLTDGKGWGSAPVALYGVNSNPYSIVIDGNGTIRKRCTTASEALNFVNAILNK